MKFNLERNRSDQRSSIKADSARSQAVEVSGPQQVTLKLSQPDSALPLILSDRAGMMCSPKAVKELGKDHDRKPVGTGPWKFVSWNDNEKVVYTRNDKYWQAGQPLLDGIEMNIIAETNTGLRSVVAGQNDFVYFLAPQQKRYRSGQEPDRRHRPDALLRPAVPELWPPAARQPQGQAGDQSRDRPYSLQQGHDGRDCGNCLDGLAHGALGLRSEAGQRLAV